MPLKKVKTPFLDIAYLDEGPDIGPALFLLHGWPDDMHAWSKISPILNRAGYRTITPSLRGFGETTFLYPDTIRDGRGVALTQDIIDLANALGIEKFFVAGHDWGGRVAYLLAALFPTRALAISAMALPFQPRGAFSVPSSFMQARLFWYQWFLCTEGGAEAFRKDPITFARAQWDTWSPRGWYREEDFIEAAESFHNPDWIAITLNGYRSRYLPRIEERTDSLYDPLVTRMSSIIQLDRPTLVIMGDADTCDSPISTAGMEKYFRGPYQRIVLPGVGHFLPREAPREVAQTLLQHFGQTAA